jgi:hypothetical protein
LDSWAWLAGDPGDLNGERLQASEATLGLGEQILAGAGGLFCRLVYWRYLFNNLRKFHYFKFVFYEPTNHLRWIQPLYPAAVSSQL